MKRPRPRSDDEDQEQESGDAGTAVAGEQASKKGAGAVPTVLRPPTLGPAAPQGGTVLERALGKPETGPPSGKVFMGNLEWRVTEEMILKVCRQFGTLVRSSFAHHHDGPLRGKPRGYCFVEFNTAEEAAKAIMGLDGRRLFGKTLKVRFSKPEGAGPDYVYPGPNGTTGAAAGATSATGGIPGGGGDAGGGLPGGLAVGAADAGASAAATAAAAASDTMAGDEMKLTRTMALLKQKLREGRLAREEDKKPRHDGRKS